MRRGIKQLAVGSLLSSVLVIGASGPAFAGGYGGDYQGGHGNKSHKGSTYDQKYSQAYSSYGNMYGSSKYNKGNGYGMWGGNSYKTSQKHHAPKHDYKPVKKVVEQYKKPVVKSYATPAKHYKKPVVKKHYVAPVKHYAAPVVKHQAPKCSCNFDVMNADTHASIYSGSDVQVGTKLWMGANVSGDAESVTWYVGHNGHWEKQDVYGHEWDYQVWEHGKFEFKVEVRDHYGKTSSCYFSVMAY